MAMYDPKNTLNVTKAAVAQLISKGYMAEDFTLDALDDASVVEIGTAINPNGDNDFTIGSPADIVFKALISQLARIDVDTRAYVASLPSLFVDPINWGLMTENIMIDLSDIMIDEMWNPNGFIPYNAAPDPATPTIFPGVEEGKRIAAIEFGFYRPAISVKLYKKIHAIMVAITTMRDQLFTAFTGVDQLNRFLAGLYNSIDNTIQLKAEVYAKMTISTAIARAYKNGNAIDLRAAAVAAGVPNAATLTAEQLLSDDEFMINSLQVISETRDYIKDYTALYNDKDMATFASEPRMAILNKFAKSAKFKVRANTYNDELLGIGEFDTVNMWQAATTASDNTPYNLAAVSGIDLSKNSAIEFGLLPEDTEETHYKLPGTVIGVVYDRLAAGITIDRKKTTTQYAASRDTINTFYHAAANYVVNDHYPIVAFYISDAA